MLSLVDIIVLILSVVTSLGIGLFLAYRNKSKSTFLEYFLGGRQLHYIPVAVSLTVTFESSILILGYPAEVFMYGISHLLIIIGYIPAFIWASFIALPLFYKMKLTSVYDYVTKRFEKDAEILRNYFVFLGGLFTLIYMSIVLLGPAFVFEALLGFPLWVSIIGAAMVATVYTSFGGMRAVVWTDAFQFFVMVAGLLAILVKVILVVGGVRNMIELNQKYDRMQLFDFNPDPRIRHTFWTLTIGSFFRVFALAFSQQTVQRLNSTSSISNARKVMMIFIVLHSIVHFLGDSCGLAAFAYYAFIGCDPIQSGKIKNPNQIVIAIVSDIFTNTPGVAGLIIAALISAALSTLSSGFNSLAAITSEELFRRKFKDWGDRKKTATAKVLVAVYGFISTILALVMMFMKGSFAQIFVSVLGALGAPTSGMFLVCLLYKRATPKSVLAGGVAGLIASLWLSIGYNFSPTLPSTPWLQPGPTDRCDLIQSVGSIVGNQTLSNITMDQHYELTLHKVGNENRSTDDVFLNSSTYNTGSGTEQNSVTTPRTPSGLDNLYSISYQYFSVVCIFVTVITALVSSLIMSIMCRQAEVDEVNTINSFRHSELNGKDQHEANDNDVAESLLSHV